MSRFKITNNTDNVDLRDKCLGLDVSRDSIPKDVADYILADRGLHIQIRHNENPQARGQANQIANLLSAAPDMLEAIETVVNKELNLSFESLCILKDAIRKARGEK